jgi:hypothetical protein
MPAINQVRCVRTFHVARTLIASRMAIEATIKKIMREDQSRLPDFEA